MSGRAKSASPNVSYIVADLDSSDDDFVFAQTHSRLMLIINLQMYLLTVVTQ